MLAGRLFLILLSIIYPICAKNYSYDLNGNIHNITTTNGNDIRVEYDSVGRVSKILYNNGKHVSYAYDANDNRIEMTDWHGTTHYAYDVHDHLIKVQYPKNAPIFYNYDLSNNLTYIKYPNGEEIFYEYNVHGRVKKVMTKEGITFFHYNNAANTLSKVNLPNGISTEYTYDLSKRVTDVVHNNPKGKPLISYHYVYDSNDNCLVKEEKTEKEKQVIKYSYDKLNRLTNVDYDDKTFERYSYDGFGNRLIKETPEETIAYTYDSNNRLVQAGKTKFFYDDAGNLSCKQVSDAKTYYFYDENDLLIEVKSSEHTITYAYDGDGKRISKTVDGTTTHYINDAAFSISQVLLEANDEGSLTSYAYAEGHLSYTSADGKECFYLYDRPAKNIAAIVGKGSIPSHYCYDGFGNTRQDDESIFQYAGEQKDEETGFIYLRNRYYDPEIGRFITPDHKQGDLFNPQSWNPYVYALNNPINRVDPLGLDSIELAAYPPGTITGDQISRAGHTFLILTRTNGIPTSLGKYPGGVSDRDQVYPGTVTHKWEITPEVCNAIEKDFGKEGPYLLFKNNCCDAALRVIKKYVDPNFGNAKLLAVNNPTSVVELITEKNREQSHYIERLHEAKNHIWERYENDALAPTSNGIQHYWRHFLGVPDQGGVSLCKTADLMVNLSEIVGAVFDEQSGQLILIGKRNYSFPHFNADDFAVAVRSVFGLGNLGPQDPGISMLPDPIPHPKHMSVRYDGETCNTEFGRIMFEADRLLKNLSLGKDNLTQKEITAHIKGYKTLPARYGRLKRKDQPKGNILTRLWFVPEEIRVVQSNDKTSMQFEEVKTIYYSYDSQGQLQTVSDNNNLISEFLYDSNNRLTAIKDAQGNTVFSTSYDIYGRAEYVQTPSFSEEQAFDIHKRTSQVVDSQTVITTNHFDKSLRLKKIEDSLNRTVELSYPKDFSSPEFIKDCLGNITKYQYDLNGYLSSIERADGSSKQFWYDNAGHLILSKTPKGQYKVNKYDDKGRVIFQAFPCKVNFKNNEEITYSYLHNDAITYEYESSLFRVYSGGKKTIYSYNENNQISSVVFEDGYSLNYSYDAFNQLKTIIFPNGSTRTFRYNQLSQPIEEHVS